MPRVARRDAPGAFHHVILRGIERGVVFRDDRDRADFLGRLGRVLLPCGVACFGFALMPNHVHLVLRTGPVPLWRAMARIGTGYAGRYNRRHDRPGHLFQNRYKAVAVESDEQLRVLVRYVHLNPVRARIVPDLAALESNAWTGHATLLGRRRAAFVAVDETLALFGETSAGGRERLRAWMSLSPSSAHASEGELGSLRFLEHLIDEVSRELGVTVGDVRGGVRRRDVVSARSIAAHLACDRLCISQEDVARLLGIGQTAVSRARERGRALLRQAPPGVAQLVSRIVPEGES